MKGKALVVALVFAAWGVSIDTASIDLNGSTDGGEIAAALTDYPITMACWVYIDVLGDYTIAGISDFSAADQYLQLHTGSGGNNDQVCITAQDGGGEVFACATTTISATTWFHATGVFTSATSRNVYLNGGNQAASGTSRTPTGEDRTTFGVRNISSGEDRNLDGRLAECGIWNVALSLAEIEALADGFQPMAIRPANLWAYLPYFTTTDDLSGNNRAFAEHGGTFTDHQPTMLLGTITPP